MLWWEMVTSYLGPEPQQCLLSGAGRGTGKAKPTCALPVEEHLFALSIRLLGGAGARPMKPIFLKICIFQNY